MLAGWVGAQMPRFFFDTVMGEQIMIDADGQGFPCLNTAELSAQRIVGELSRECLHNGYIRPFPLM